MAITFDYSAGTPWVVTDAIEDAIRAAGASDRSVREAIDRERTRQFRTNPAFRERFRDRFRKAGVDVASVTVDAGPPRDDLLRWQAIFDAADWLHKVTTPEAARDVAGGMDDNDDGDEPTQVGILLNTRNLGRITGRDLDRIDPLWDAGLRVFQLTYNTQNALGAGCYERADGGLSNAGADAVERLNELGGVVDTAHCGHRTTLDAVETSAAPVAATHVSCAAVAEHPRAKTDEELNAIADAGGYVGVVGVSWFLAPDADDPALDVFFEHVEHAVSVVDPDQVGIGTDFGNVDVSAPDAYVTEARERAVAAGFPEGYGEGYGTGFGEMARHLDWPRLREGLAERFDDETVRGILGENFLSFWERVRAA